VGRDFILLITYLLICFLLLFIFVYKKQLETDLKHFGNKFIAFCFDYYVETLYLIIFR